MRVQSISLPDGTILATGNLTVLIGPNNSGKTQVLKDILNSVLSPVANRTVLSAVNFEEITDVKQLLNGTTIGERKFKHQQTDSIRGLQPNLTSGREVDFHLDNYRTLENPQNIDTFGSQMRLFQAAFLDAHSRLAIVKQSPANNPQVDQPNNLLQALFVDEGGAEKELNEIFDQIFGLRIRLDCTSLKDLCLRVGRDIDAITHDTRKAYKLMCKQRLLDHEGEGMMSFVSIVLSMLVCSKRILLIDEPEAFLHPAHARQLGRWMAGKASTSAEQLFVATHSASFLAGIVSAGVPVNIVRLSRDETSCHFSAIAADKINSLATSPLLSSQRVLESLFHRGVILSACRRT